MADQRVPIHMVPRSLQTPLGADRKASRLAPAVRREVQEWSATQEANMINVAYSYLRFSTPEQAAGDSRRRQIAMAEKYAAAHHLKLDLHLSFRDLGVSAYRGRNAKEGALRAFLEAIEYNLVPPNSYLLVESLDRLSRDRILAAQTLFMQIVQAGITIVTLVDQRSYSLESLNQNPLDLVISLVTMMRANEESEIKSSRIRAAFDVKRDNLTKKPWS